MRRFEIEIENKKSCLNFIFVDEDAAFGSALRGAMIFGLAILFIFVGCHFVMTVLLLIGNEQVWRFFRFAPCHTIQVRMGFWENGFKS